MFYERLKDLCKQRSLSLTNVVKELGMSTGNLSKWKSGIIPKSDTINALSEYFNVPTDYLLGNEETVARLQKDSINMLDSKSLIVTERERRLIEKFRLLDAEGQTMVESAVIAETRRMAAKGEEESNVG